MMRLLDSFIKELTSFAKDMTDKEYLKFFFLNIKSDSLIKKFYSVNDTRDTNTDYSNINDQIKSRRHNSNPPANIPSSLKNLVKIISHPNNYQRCYDSNKIPRPDKLIGISNDFTMTKKDKSTDNNKGKPNEVLHLSRIIEGSKVVVNPNREEP